MHKRLVIALIAICSFLSGCVLAVPADDTAFISGSGVKEIWLHDNKAKELANLGMLWGFIKYYHANVNKGDYNMDVALFRVLPAVLAADNTDSANAIMERWVDGFGKPAVCAKCKPFTKTENTKHAPDYGYLFTDGNLPASLRAKLEYIKQNRYTGKEHYYIDAAPYIGNPIFKNERDYAATPLPDAGTRLLALYRYWNMIQYFYPNRQLSAEDWNRVLEKMIPVFANANDLTEYQLACIRLIALVNDTHGAIVTGMNALQEYKGKYMTPFAAQFVEDKLVVIGYYKDTLNVTTLVKPGDVIEQIDGVSIIDLIRRYLPLVPASNYEKKLSNMARSIGFLLRSNNAEAKLTINRDGQMMQVSVPRITADTAMAKADFGAAPAEGYKMLANNIGYLYPAKLNTSDLDVIIDSFEKTKGIIIDMRCYPTVFMTFDYGKWLKPDATPFVHFTTLSTDMPGQFEFSKTSENGGGKGKHYAGKVIILVNTRTQSSAEYQTMALQTAPRTKVIGSQTSGADGNVSDIVLPGGIKTKLSGIGIIYPNGTESQCAGVKIDKEVRPTIKGIKEGKDEVLEEAIRMINE